MEFVKIVGMCVLGACVYGIVHDQVTARLCIEYFTVAHPPMVRSDSPAIQGLFWGVFATWWMGAIAGMLLGACARIGRRHRMPARGLRRPLIGTLAVMGVVAILGGIVGRVMAEGHVRLVGRLAERIPEDRHDEFLIVAWAHGASYLAGVIAIVALAGWVVGRRGARGASHTRSCPDRGQGAGGGVDSAAEGGAGS